MSNKCFAGMRKVTSHSERNSMILASSLGRMFWVALNAGSRSGTCTVVGTPTVPLAYSSAKKENGCRTKRKEEAESFSKKHVKVTSVAWQPHATLYATLLFFPSNAFMAFARSLHTFNRSKKMNCKLSCKAVYSSIASKALVMDLYTVQ